MKIIRCDNHPDRETVATLSIKILKPGSRPMILGLETPGHLIDLCEECINTISPIIKKEIINASS